MLSIEKVFGDFGNSERNYNFRSFLFFSVSTSLQNNRRMRLISESFSVAFCADVMPERENSFVFNFSFLLLV